MDKVSRKLNRLIRGRRNRGRFPGGGVALSFVACSTRPMSLPDAASLERVSPAELRGLVGALVAEVRRLQSEVETQQVAITALRSENQALRDEVARLKGLPPRPPSRPSGMEKAVEAGRAGKPAGERSKQRRGPKRDQDAITADRVCKAAAPAGSRFKV